MKLKAVFIDIDNTLLDFDEYVKQTMDVGFKHFGLKPYEPYMFDVFTAENNMLWRRIEDATLTFEELLDIRWNTIFKKLEIEADGVEFEKYFRQALFESAIPVEGATETLKKMREKYVICAASNGPFDQQIHRLEIADMLKLFDNVFISEDIGFSKPAKEFFEEAFRRINSEREKKILPEECIIIGDSMSSDMAGGKICGMKTCYYRRNKDEIVEEGRVDIVADNLADIPKLIENL